MIWWFSLSEVIDGLINWPHLLPFLLPLHVVWLGDSCGQAGLNEASFTKGGEEPRAVANRKLFRLTGPDISNLAFTGITLFKTCLRCLLQSALTLYWCGVQWNSRGTCWIFWSKLEAQPVDSNYSWWGKEKEKTGYIRAWMTLDFRCLLRLTQYVCSALAALCLQLIPVHTTSEHNDISSYCPIS